MSPHGHNVPPPPGDPARPVLRRLLPPLAAILALLVGGSCLLLWLHHQAHVHAHIQTLKDSIFADFFGSLRLQAGGLENALAPVCADPRLLNALQAADVPALLADWSPLFDSLRAKNRVSHFLFIDPNLSVLLRLHAPDLRGDPVSRPAVLKAQRSGASAWGLEIGKVGSLVLRAVFPVDLDGQRIGYAEMGLDVDQLVERIRLRPGIQLAIVLRKDRLDPALLDKWLRDPLSNPNLLPNGFVAYSSAGHLPTPFAAAADPAVDAAPTPDRNASWNGRSWHLASSPLRDASGAVVGILLLAIDLSEEDQAIFRLLLAGGGAAACLLAALLAFVVVLLRRTDDRIRSQADTLRSQAARLRSLSRHLQNAGEVETRRLAVWLHDEIGQMLTRARMDAMLLDDLPPPRRDTVASLMKTLDDSVAAVRHASRDLRPPLLDDFGLAAAIEWNLRDNENRMRIPLRFEASAVPDNLDPAVADALYRAYREAIVNVARHARASSASVRLCAENGRLRLVVRDDGRGMDPQAPDDPSSFGLALVRERADALGGFVRFVSSPGQGTAVVVDVPLSPPPQPKGVDP